MKNTKAIILFLFISLVLIVLLGMKVNKEFFFQKDSTLPYKTTKNKEIPSKRTIMVADKLYYDTGEISKVKGRCGVMDGTITSHVGREKIPTQNNEANFSGNYSYQFASKNTIEVNINREWIIFKGNEDYPLDFQSDTFALESIENKETNPKVYYQEAEQTIYLVGLTELYLKDENNKISLQEYLTKSNRNIDSVIYDIIPKFSYEAGIYDGGTMIYRDGGRIKKEKSTPKVTNHGLTIMLCNKMGSKKGIYIGASNLDYDKNYNKYCNIKTSI